MKALTTHLGTPGQPGAMSRSEAASKGAAVERMVESEGWTVLTELIANRLRHEQKTLMQSPVRDEETYDRLIGAWAGMERIPLLAAGIIEVGKQASLEMEKGEAAEAASG